MKPILVGENNPYGSDPRFALYPAPQNSAGGRLCRLVLGMTAKQYIGSFERANLLSASKWSVKQARFRAEEMLRERAADGATFVLLGEKVANAFGFEFKPYTATRRWDYDAHQFVLLPPPSGKCFLWNEPGSYERARALLREVGALA